MTNCDAGGNQALQPLGPQRHVILLGIPASRAPITACIGYLF